MEESLDNLVIKRIYAHVNNSRDYIIDIDSTNTIYELKKIISNAAHLLKNTFKILFNNSEFNNENDNLSLDYLFPNLNEIHLDIISLNNDEIYEDPIYSIKFNIKKQCENHIGKFEMYYCFSCNKSICGNCLLKEHKDHFIEEKADYLAPSKEIINKIFSDNYLYKPKDIKINHLDSINLKANLTEIFIDLHKDLNKLEEKIINSINYYILKYIDSGDNLEKNIELLQKYCIEYFIKFKNDINSKYIVINDEVFLILYNKLKHIEKFRTDLFQNNLNIFKNLNLIYKPFVYKIKNVINELINTIKVELDLNIYDNIKTETDDNFIYLIEKEEVEELIFKDIGINKNNIHYKEILFDLKNKKNLNNNMSNINNMTNNRNIIHHSPKLKTNSSQIIFKKFYGDDYIFNKSKVNDNFYFNNYISAKRNKNKEYKLSTIKKEKSIMDESMKSKESIIFDYNKPSVFEKLFDSNINLESIYNINNSNEITLINNISNSNKNENSNKINKGFRSFDNNYTIQLKEFPKSKFENSNLDLLLNKKNTENLKEKKLDNNININKNLEINNINFSEAQENIDIKKQNIYHNFEQNLNLVNEEENKIILFYPIIGNNIILGTYNDQSIVKFEINLKDKFEEENLKNFINGGSYCNFNSYLYFSGGIEYYKGLSKIFFRMSISKNNEIILDKLPPMIYCHWNHSMIGYKNYIFSIGGYNFNKSEYYDINNFKWEIMSNLNCENIQHPMLCIFKEYLYSFMGHKSINILNTIERLNTNNLFYNKWEVINYKNNDNINVNFYGAGIICNKNEIFFIGGKYGLNNNEVDYKYKILSFDLNNNSFCDKKISSTTKLSFLESQLYKINGNIYGNFCELSNGSLATIDINNLYD